MSIPIDTIDVDLILVGGTEHPTTKQTSILIAVAAKTTQHGLNLTLSLADAARLERLLAVAVAELKQRRRDAIQRN